MENVTSNLIVIIYTAMLYIAGVCNVIFATLLISKVLCKRYRPFPYYRRALWSSAVAMLVFGLPYFLHAHFSIRFWLPLVATVIGLTSFHIGALLFAYAYSKILDPKPWTRKHIAFNVITVTVSVITYWYYPVDYFSQPEFSLSWPQPVAGYVLFFSHALYLAVSVYRLYSKVKHTDPELTARNIKPFIESLSNSVHVIVACGIGSIALYCIFPDSLVMYTSLMFLAYFAFYYIYRSLSNYGHNLLSDKKSKASAYSRLFRYNALYHFTLLFVLLGIYYIYQDKDAFTVNEDKEFPHMNLTKHSLWDNPNFEDGQMTEFVLYLLSNLDESTTNLYLELSDDSTKYERKVEISHLIDSIPDDRSKGFLQIIAYETVLSSMPANEITPESLHDYIEKIYKVAQGTSPIPQSAFFACWETAVSGYINIHCTDSVKSEAQRLLTICRQQNIPYGIIQAYISFGLCLLEVYDYQGASQQLETAIELLEEYLSENYGKDWRETPPDEASGVSSYLYAKATNFECHVESYDTLWLRENYAEAEKILEEVKVPNSLDVECVLYYSLAVYHDKWGDKRKYDTLMKEFHTMLEKTGAFKSNNFSTQKEKYLYYTARVRHHLRNNEPDEAIKYINMIPDFLGNYSTSYIPDAMLQQGRYEEAAKHYKKTIDYYYQQLNGRNRTLFSSISSGLGNEAHQMQIMQAQLREQQTHLMYNSLLIFIFGIMVIGLAHFLVRQRRLNKELSAAIEAEKRARHVKDIFLKNMTHEFHTPLNAIYGFSQILADPEFPLDEESTREMASDMIKSSEHITRLLDNIVEVTDKLSELDHLEDVESIIKENTNSE